MAEQVLVLDIESGNVEHATLDIECASIRDIDHFDNPYRRDRQVEVIYIRDEHNHDTISAARDAIFFPREPYYNGHPRSIRETRRSQKRGHKR